jgi:LuxR family maltose regulon positive regulatory protein
MLYEVAYHPEFIYISVHSSYLIATLRGSGLVTEIRISDLMFTPDEAAAFLHGMLGIDIDMETAKLLDVKTEGWAVGLRLAGLYLRGENDPKARVRELSGRSSFIADYLFAEVLSQAKFRIGCLSA